MICNSTSFELAIGGEMATVSVDATLFNSKVLLQLRFNGEMDSTYEVTKKRMGHYSIDQPLVGETSLDEDYDDDYAHDFMSDYNIVTRLGNSNDTKLPVICAQIVELYNRVIIPSLNVKNELGNDVTFIITLSTKIWKTPNGDDFEKLLMVLKHLKIMYDI